MTEAPKFKTGEMPNTDFRYEEFEGLLGSYFLSLSPLLDVSEQDKADFQVATEALNKLAEGQGVQHPEAAVTQPRPTMEEWGKAEAFETPSMLLDSFNSFRTDFGVGFDPGTPDSEQRVKLVQTVLGVLDRHGVIKAKFEEREGKRYPVGIAERNEKLMSSPLREVLRPTV